jgi:hypothetical protein
MTGRNSAVVYVEGYPQPGAEPTTFFDMPRWATPASAWPAQSLFAPLAWELRDQGTETALVIEGQQVVWVVYPGRDATTTRLPAPPSSVDWESLFGTDPLAAYVRILEWDESRTFLRRYAESTAVMLQP